MQHLLNDLLLGPKTGSTAASEPFLFKENLQKDVSNISFLMLKIGSNCRE